jgi:hypothetical protein
MEMEHQAPKVNWESVAPEVSAHFTAEEAVAAATTAAVEEDQTQSNVAPTLVVGVADLPTRMLH